jgi:hypothetical protein
MLFQVWTLPTASVDFPDWGDLELILTAPSRA